MKKLKIYVFAADFNEIDYIDMQISSYKLFMQDENTDFIVVNGSVSNRNEIYQICQNHNIECISYERDSDNPDYSGDRSSKSYFYGGTYYDWLMNNIVKNSNDYIMTIHPDMFFIKKLDYKKLLSNKPLYFVPRYHVGLFYIWEGVIILDSEYFNKNNLTDSFILSGGFDVGDGGSKTRFMLEKMNDDYSFFEMRTLITTDGVKYNTSLNGHVNYLFDINDRKLFNTSSDPMHGGSENRGLRMSTKSYPYEDDNNYEENYINSFERINKNFIDGFNFPNPISIDLINVFTDDDPFLLHFKSGSGYPPFHNNNYKFEKLKAIESVIKIRSEL